MLCLKEGGGQADAGAGRGRQGGPVDGHPGLAGIFPLREPECAECERGILEEESASSRTLEEGTGSNTDSGMKVEILRNRGAGSNLHIRRR
ncbi:hypothetical protein R1flu_006802 [Riccia fluitans]|uniref:Uncharacterized protein n=1 Tax=Riccia fluitans TaxID=41844 RepID=A0ABD1YX96_9MARC